MNAEFLIINDLSSSDGKNRSRISEIIDNQFSFLYHTLPENRLLLYENY
ncbi:MAG: hypothetical protein U5P10_16585 [Spirochaetia bacterium]|nr:hypothetical protein [Spirochaetia bacterium]